MQSHQRSVFVQKQKDHFLRLFPELDSLELSDKALQILAESTRESGYHPHTYSKVIPIGLAHFSQFIAHDLTFESTSVLHGRNDLRQFQNDRTFNLDLDCVYGQRTQDFLYDANDPAKLLLGRRYEKDGHVWYDLQRNAQDKAIIPDARNDENIIVSRIQVLFIQFHNRMVDHLRRQGYKGDLFAEARRHVIWHYHWLILYEYLYLMMDWDVFGDILEKGCKYYTWPVGLPLEFSGAAFRVGHSQARGQNRINSYTEKGLFELGFFRKMEDHVDWSYCFDMGDGKCEFARLLDTKVAHVLHDIPFVQSENRYDRSLPFRNLKRGVQYGLPPGEAVARRLGFEPIVVEITQRHGWPGTPLWYYILREAESVGHEGEHLGPVGSTIMGECLMTILRHDDYSFFKLHPKWKPSLGREAGKFDFQDMIRFCANE